MLVTHAGARLPLRARVNPELRPGLARVADEHAAELGGFVEVEVAP